MTVDFADRDQQGLPSIIPRRQARKFYRVDDPKLYARQSQWCSVRLPRDANQDHRLSCHLGCAVKFDFNSTPSENGYEGKLLDWAAGRELSCLQIIFFSRFRSGIYYIGWFGKRIL